MFELKRVGKAKSECLYVYKEMKVEDGEKRQTTTTKQANKQKRQTHKRIGRKEIRKSSSYLKHFPHFENERIKQN